MKNIPDDNLAYPVLILFNTGASGSGFFLTTTKNIYLITAKHVLFDDKDIRRGDKIEVKGYSIDLKKDSNYTLLIDLNKFEILKHKIADVAAIKIGSLNETAKNKTKTIIFNDMVLVKSHKKIDIANVSLENIKKLDEIFISNDVFLYGYPTSLGFKNIPQINYNQPLLRKGIIANLYKDLGTIILDCFVFPGNSGGPIIEVSLEVIKDGLNFSHKVIGVVSQFVPYLDKQGKDKDIHLHNSGYSVAVCMDKVLELIDEWQAAHRLGRAALGGRNF